MTGQSPRTVQRKIKKAEERRAPTTRAEAIEQATALDVKKRAAARDKADPGNAERNRAQWTENLKNGPEKYVIFIYANLTPCASDWSDLAKQLNWLLYRDHWDHSFTWEDLAAAAKEGFHFFVEDPQGVQHNFDLDLFKDPIKAKEFFEERAELLHPNPEPKATSVLFIGRCSETEQDAVPDDEEDQHEQGEAA